MVDKGEWTRRKSGTSFQRIGLITALSSGLCYRKLKTQPFLIRWSSSTVDTVGVQDTV
jgi:hypothetical protein